MMQQICEPHLCSGCGACANGCGRNAIALKADEKGFLHPVIDGGLCVDCGRCKAICPVVNPPEPDDRFENYGLAAFSADEGLRTAASSGGLFPLLANSVLSEGGVVYGVAFDEDWKKVRHIRVTAPTELPRLFGAKYLQSETGSTFCQVRQDLVAGKRVLFAGTPCQTAGLKAYLGRDWTELLLVDVICHGTPSQRVWAAYLTELEARYGARAENVSFRDKRGGWKDYRLSVRFSNGEEYLGRQVADAYLRGFISDLFLRESCHQCRFKGERIQSDLTLGDFWGIDHVLPEMNDELGISLVIIRSDRGEAALKACSDRLRTQRIDLRQAVSHNPAAVRSSGMHKERETFFRQLDNTSVSCLVERFRPLSGKERLRLLIPANVKRTLKRLLRR